MYRYLYRLATDQADGILPFFFKTILLVLSRVYGGAVRILAGGYQRGILRRHRLPRPVISVGNITLGGVGKTPFVQWLADRLREKGMRPAVLMRGYMLNSRSQGVESDEAAMLRAGRNGVPVGVGADRGRAAGELLRQGAVDVFILDDGFQHWRLQRDLDIVLLDATNPFGNGCLLPRGILREPPAALKRTEALVITKSDCVSRQELGGLRSRLESLSSAALIAEAVHQPDNLVDMISGAVYPLSYLRNKSVVAVSSIGDPKGFERTLSAVGADIRNHFAFLDHHVYAARDIAEINKFCETGGVAWVITTAKDAVKLRPLERLLGPDRGWQVLNITIRVTNGRQELCERIDRLLQR